MANSQIQIVVARQLDPILGKIILHVVPVNSRLHWLEDGVCWCSPSVEYREIEEIGEPCTLYNHRTYKPNWG